MFVLWDGLAYLICLVFTDDRDRDGWCCHVHVQNTSNLEKAKFFFAINKNSVGWISIQMVVLYSVFQWCSISNKMAAILSKTIGYLNKILAILFGFFIFGTSLYHFWWKKVLKGPKRRFRPVNVKHLFTGWKSTPESSHFFFFSNICYTSD